jgi:ankyrin repeat protein
MLNKALRTLPPTLDQTYERILSAISGEHAEYAMRILQWLTFSERPLTVEEVAEVVAIDVGRDPAFERDEVLEDPLEALKICSSLVTITTDTVEGLSWSPIPIFALAHYSVQEYLVSDGIKQGSAKQYSMQEAECHSAIAKGTLKYLLQFQQPISEEVVESFALARYSARFWCIHLEKTEGDIERLSRLAMSLMTIEGPAYLTLVRLSDPDLRLEDFRRNLNSVPTPLYYCAQLGLSTLTRLLLDRGDDVNAQGGGYSNALQAASFRGHEQVVKILLDQGADINAQSRDYSNALQAASFRGHEQVVKILLDQGADVNAQSGYYSNALHAASCNGHEQVVKILLDQGADVNAQGGKYSNALQAASSKGHEQVVKILLDQGADINAQSRDYSNALQAASFRGHEQVVKILLDQGADVNAQGRIHGNALQVASSIGHEQIVQILLDQGADVNAQSGYYGNALHAASCNGHEQVVKMLLAAGAHLPKKTNLGLRPA